MRVLLLTPPLTQLNTPYPATSYLTGFLRSRGVDAVQADLSLDTALAVFSRSGLGRLFSLIRERGGTWPEPVEQALDLADAYQDTIEPVVTFLQGRDPTLATRIAAGGFLPEGPRLAGREDDRWAFGSLGTTDRAKHLASLYLDDLSDLISSTVDPLWGLSRYGEQLAASAPSFDPLAQALAAPPGFATGLLEARVRELTCGPRPDLVGITVPFPGNLYGALRTAAILRRAWPDVPIVLGGGYANTELRDLAEPRLFDYVDYVTMDAGERPLLCLLDLLAGKRDVNSLCRTFARGRDRVVYHDGAGEPDIPFEHTGTPTYVGLDLSRYLSIVEVPNPMHRLWSDGRWNKLTVAHGCYWKRCAFCDVDLDYIKRYEPAPAALLLDRIDALIAETGQSGFHFVDEAAPPARLVDLAIALLETRTSHLLVGQHSIRSRLHRGRVPAAGRVGVHRGQRGAGNRVRPAVGPDGQGRHGGPGRADHAPSHPRGDHGPRVPDVRLSHRNLAGDDRCARARAPVFCGGSDPVRILAPVCRHGAQPGGTQPERIRHFDRSASRRRVCAKRCDAPGPLLGRS